MLVRVLDCFSGIGEAAQKMRSGAKVLLLAVLCFGTPLLHASTVLPILPNADFSNGLPVGAYSYTGQDGALVTVAQYYSGGKGVLDVVGYPSTSANPTGGVQYSVYLSYYTEVYGPANVTVPVDIVAAGFATVPTIGNNYALVSATLDGSSVQACAGFPGNLSCPHVSSQSLPTNEVINVPSNTPLVFTMLAEGQAYNLTGNAAPFHAYIDPSVTIDPSFTTPGYTVLFSPDLGAPPVPLPATAWLLLSGLTALGFATRKGRQAN